MISEYYIKHTEDLSRIKASGHQRLSNTQFDIYDMNSPSSMSYIYLLDMEIIGYLMSQVVLDEVHIHDIVVEKKFRNKGIGSAMISHLIDLAKHNNKSKVYLEVNSKNIIAIELYSKLGFVKSGIRNKYYNNIDDAILMDLWI